jgi:hypothetical protein
MRKLIQVILSIVLLTATACSHLPADKPPNYQDMARDAGGSALLYDLNGSPVATDQLLGIDDPSGSWAINRFSIQAVFDLMEADISGFSIHVDNLATGGITDGSVLEVDGSPNSGEFPVFTASGLDGQTAAERRTAIDVRAQTNGLLDISNLTWTGEIIDDAVAGEELSQGMVYYAKWDTASVRIFAYSADSTDTDNATWLPEGLVLTSGTINAGDTISVTIGQGAFRNDDWTFSYQTDEGKPIYASQTAGYITRTQPSDEGDRVIRIGTIRSVEGGSYGDVVFFHFAGAKLTVTE